MKEQRLEILQKVANGDLTPEQADEQLLGLSNVRQSLALVEVDPGVLQICVDAYKGGERLDAIQTLIEEVKKVYKFGIKQAKEWFEANVA